MTIFGGIKLIIRDSMNLSNKNGFLLIELVVVLAIITFFISSTLIFRSQALHQQGFGYRNYEDVRSTQCISRQLYV